MDYCWDVLVVGKWFFEWDFVFEINGLFLMCRGYYKCSSMWGCLVCKYVECLLEDLFMFIIIYEGEYNYFCLIFVSVVLLCIWFILDCVLLIFWLLFVVGDFGL